MGRLQAAEGPGSDCRRGSEVRRIGESFVGGSGKAMLQEGKVML